MNGVINKEMIVLHPLRANWR